MGNVRANKATEKTEAVKELRKMLKPGDRVYTVLRSVSASGMSRRIDVFVMRKNEPRRITWHVARALEYREHKDGGITVGGCGMDMGYAVVHNLGYAIWGFVQESDSAAATKIRKRLAVACKSYLTQGGAAIPDTGKPSQDWFGAAGYALQHSWL